MNKKRAFLSFIFEDLDHIRGLRLLNANPDYDLEFNDQSVQTAINSTDSDYIKNVIKEKINKSSATVCLISENTFKSKWVDWELEKASSLNKPIIAMAIKGVDRAILPTLIKEKNISFLSWDPLHLAALIKAS